MAVEPELVSGIELSELQPARMRAKAITVRIRIGPLSFFGRLDGVVRASPLQRAYTWLSHSVQRRPAAEGRSRTRDTAQNCTAFHSLNDGRGAALCYGAAHA